MSNKLRIKHLTENNTRESIPGELILSNVTGHVSVRDNYFVNSATKDIIGRINSLNQMCDYLDSIDEMYKDSAKYNKEYKLCSEAIADNKFIDSYNIVREDYMKLLSKEISEKTPGSEVKQSANKLKDSIHLNINNDKNGRIDILKKLAAAEEELTTIELWYKELEDLNEYVLEQQFTYERYLDELKDDVETANINYKELCDRHEIFSKYMEGKYIALSREFNIKTIELIGGVLGNGEI